MSFDLKTVPKFGIQPGVSGDIKIFCHSKEPWIYYLHQGNHQLMMIDFRTNREIKELYPSYDLAYGDVLISGLGFGILALWLANKPKVKSVKVIEKSQNVVDLFLKCNQLPDNVSIELADISTYKSDAVYDCILLDHFPDHLPNNKQHLTIEGTKQICLNIPNHTLVWSFFIEYIYLNKYFNLTWDDLVFNPVDLNQYDLYSKWSEYIDQDIIIPTFPKLTKEKLIEYIYTYFNYI